MLEDWSAVSVIQADPMRAYREKRDEAHRSVQSKYNFLGFISSGTYGRVYKVQAKDIEGSGTNAGKIYAAKKFKPDKEGEVVTYTGISQSAIREIALNREIHHENIAALKEVILEDKSIYMIFEYAEHDFLQVIHHHSQSLRSQISMPVLKSLIYQLLNGVLYLHSCHILHRDLKPANILITSQGVVKVGDLGLARLVYEPLQPLIAGDRVVVTIWYRAPELLLGAKHYTKAIDIWAVGCVLAELASLRPIFKGEEAKMDSKKNVPFQRDQLIKIFEVRGTPDVNEWPGLKHMPEYQNMKRLERYKDRLGEWWQSRFNVRNGSNGYDLLRHLFAYDPEKRLTAREALEHKWFQEDPLPTRNAFLSLSASQLPPQRRLTHDEASSAMLPVNAAARAPPPAPASTTRTVSGVPSFSGGFGAAAGSGSYTTSQGGGYNGMGLSRLPAIRERKRGWRNTLSSCRLQIKYLNPSTWVFVSKRNNRSMGVSALLWADHIPGVQVLHALTMRYKQYEVWIEMDKGHMRMDEYSRKLNTDPYGDDKTERATCYIASEIGKTFTIHIVDCSRPLDRTSLVNIFIDGVLADDHIIDGEGGSNGRKSKEVNQSYISHGVAVSMDTHQKYMFTASGALRGKPSKFYNKNWIEDVGSIIVEICQAEIRPRSFSNSHSTFQSPSFLELAKSPLMAKARTKYTHRIGLQSEPTRLEGSKYMGIGDVFDKNDSHNIIIFEFKYRPKHILEEKGIVIYQNHSSTERKTDIKIDEGYQFSMMKKNIRTEKFAGYSAHKFESRRERPTTECIPHEKEQGTLSALESPNWKDGKARKRAYESEEEEEDATKDVLLHNMRLHLKLLQGQMAIIQKRQRYTTRSIKDTREMLVDLEFWQCVAHSNQKEQLKVMRDMREQEKLKRITSERPKDALGFSNPPRKRHHREA